MINGIINIYKEAGFTSHDVVAKLRGITKQKKIGHTGTLDPDATGVLPVCLGRATKVSGMLTDARKTYECVLLLGVTTDTQDISGKVLEERSREDCLKQFDEAAVRNVIHSYLGPQMQVPPMYSALKKDGKKLYELARAGQVVEREPRPVHFYEIEVLRMDLPRVTMRVTCSKGTYIRTLCHDIGQKLGCGGCMEKLIRTKVGSFSLEKARTLREVEALRDAGRLADCLIPVDRVFSGLPAVEALEAGDHYLHNGNPVDLSLLQAIPDETQDRFRVYDSAGAFVGIFYKDLTGGRLKPETMFYDGKEPS